MVFTESVRSRQVPETPLHIGLAAELAFGADFAGDAGDFVGEGGELVDHRVDGPSDPQELAPQRPAVDVVGMCWVRSPSATASITRAASVAGRAR